MKRSKLSGVEQAIERSLLRGEYRPVGREEFERVARAIKRRKKDAVLNIRMNSQDLEGIKKRAKDMGIPYQTFISELLHHYAA